VINVYEKIVEILESGTQAEYKLEEIARIMSEGLDDVMEDLAIIKEQLEVVLEQERY